MIIKKLNLEWDVRLKGILPLFLGVVCKQISRKNGKTTLMRFKSSIKVATGF
jgi:hypothetical protein